MARSPSVELCGTVAAEFSCANITYPLVNVYITMENHNFSWENLL